MRVTEPHGQRFELALERLRDRDSFNLEDVSFWLAPDGNLEVSVESKLEKFLIKQGFQKTTVVVEGEKVAAYTKTFVVQ